MVRNFSFSSCIVFFFVSNLSGFSQEESGLSLMEATWANTEAIQNYDVSYKHWQGFAPSETPSEDFSESTECVTYGRLVVDRKEENILFVREMILDLTTKHRKNFECFIWRKGIETAFSKNSPYPSTRMCDFIRFNALRQIPIVELTQSSFPCTLAKENLREIHDSSTRLYHESKCIRHPDGSSTVFVKRDNTRLRSHVTFDPVSSMPTKIVVSEFDPKTNALIRNLASGNPRYEKSKEIYRIVSITYDKLELAGQDLILKSGGACEFTWHQFNEEFVQFPDTDGNTFGVAEAEKFLRIGIGEQSK